MEGWVVALTAVADNNGNLTQLYPPYAAAGAAAPFTSGATIRQPTEGQIYSLQIQTDGTNGGILELWDISGLEVGADVSSATAITNTQKNAGVSAGVAKLIYSQNFDSDPITPINMGYKGFMKGLAARLITSGGTGGCNLNITVNGGFRYITKL